MRNVFTKTDARADRIIKLAEAESNGLPHTQTFLVRSRESKESDLRCSPSELRQQSAFSQQSEDHLMNANSQPGAPAQTPTAGTDGRERVAIIGGESPASFAPTRSNPSTTRLWYSNPPMSWVDASDRSDSIRRFLTSSKGKRPDA